MTCRFKILRALKIEALFWSAVVVTSSCSTAPSAPEPDDSDRLYSGSLSILRAAADSIAAASDSVEARAIFARANSRLDALALSVAPDTDLLLTEGENDTLFMEVTRLRSVLATRFSSLAHINPPDSI